MKVFNHDVRAAIVYMPGQGYMIVTPWMHGTGGGRFSGDHHVDGNPNLPMLKTEVWIFPDTDEGRREASDYCMFLNDRQQLTAAENA